MPRVAVLLLALAAIAFATAQAAPAEVAPVVAEQGYFIEPGADATDDVVGRAVSDARSAGSRFFAVVLAVEPPSGATFYADSILDRLPNQEGTVLVVAPATVGWAKNLDDTWSDAELNEALDASLDGSTSDDVVTIFVGTLVGTSGSGSGGGNGAWILLAIVLVVGGGIAFLVWRGARRSRALEAEQLADLKDRARAQVAAIANDILDDEDEIAEAANPEASAHFQSATTTYAAAAERIDRATTASDVVEIAADLDEAIWHLDAAEAILDGAAVPPKPERPTVPAPEPAPESAPAPGSTTSTTSDSSSLPPLPEYRRRSNRRAGFGADDMLKTVLAMQAMRSLSGGGRRSSSRSSRRSSGGSGGRRSSGGRSRGGGRRRG